MSTKAKAKGPFLVVYDDASGLCIPMGWNPECEGAIQAIMPGGTPIIFPSRSAASKAIKVSTLNALLLKAQGKAHNDDFIEHSVNVRILECVAIHDVEKKEKP